MIPFVRSHGLGNDYLVLQAEDLPAALTPRAVQRLCDRHRGVGGDGILLVISSRTADFGVRIFNPDGSEAEKSGNGLRILAKYLVEHRGAARRFAVETRGGIVSCECDVAEGRVVLVAVEMGVVTFGDVETPLDVGGRSVPTTIVSIGNPHCVVLVDQLDEAELRRLGPLIEHHPRFPARTNVQCARVVSRREVAALVWERGAGYTLASGSSACAVAATAVRVGRCDPGEVHVAMPGGRLTVEVRGDWSLRLAGPVEEICAGTLSAELEGALAS